MNAPAALLDIAETKKAIPVVLSFNFADGTHLEAAISLPSAPKRGGRHYVVFSGNMLFAKQCTGWYEVIEVECPRWRACRVTLGHLPLAEFAVDDERTSFAVPC
ncbi:MAG: hypothetical protein A3C93_01185 [Candidatus Lloydbacteria bacterium RIFCSPHIGHO2_02_FULL_54_17]|uniref:Uncharacterized protein n=1 Tax=Candidatus Lloydbacteria bacterium RIFCSPHIGHO2_02_FULL_54_17 TaxID=1798664 RepID=A0A1G2DDI3_9BACT|nr:MAG: hypothetical protein A3C93_01185 [Candidatus Lloydbacteria bacterium RIFCSPHIGHO2_02_FULL_54_17]OGZ14410.1 MAG: hypothetical protein A2948_00540 [Candidatus Lloydbacteria bacterium RIFCSPLOWO2_01_FULL_54_18]OGZ16797.1 MAG: hypothetical protein A3H76_02050 [Candidatus Lloydbacteria bacterium RIFCSPLOWO2_02_FULL_54_12]